MKPVRRGVKELSMVVRMFQVPVTNVSVRVEICRRGYTTQSLVNFEIDCCQFWLTKRRNPMAHAVYKFFRLDTYSNLNHSCPYNNDLIIDHLPFDKDLKLLIPIGRGEYVMKMYWKIHNVLRCTIDVNLQIAD
ncbi:uncharacterized protein LOC117785924 [Drosophila innubila]|uniref:uncharacterized protein LOC117785924 n=1 Tax=Drosophila innubila TaxID=198719 RepID=UPI00148DC218|nr:uncharacterized protein LOC117785924 [Drosophila innubila]